MRKAQTKAININDLPETQSRVEQYLDFLCGRAVDINALPIPQSRIEIFLKYLCYHGIGGGGGGNPHFIGITGVKLVDDTRLIFTKSDGNEIPIDLDSFPVLDDVNDFKEDSWFKDVILSKTDFVDTSEYGQTSDTTLTRNRFIGIREHSSKLFNGYISHVKIYCANNSVKKIDNVEVYSVTKGADLSKDRVAAHLISNGTYDIQTENNVRFVEIPINKHFEKDTYLLIRDNSVNNVLKARNGVSSTLTSHIVNSSTTPVIGQAPKNEASYLYDMVVYGGASVKDVLDDYNELLKALVTQVNILHSDLELARVESAKLDEANTFTKDNTFIDHRPKITKDFELATFGEGLSLTGDLLADGYYFVDLSYKFKSDKTVSHLIVPIKGASVGDKISTSYFIVNADTKEVIGTPSVYKEYEVEDIDYMGCKCIKITVDKVYNTNVICFGLRVQNSNNKGLNLVVTHRTNNSWTGNQTPVNTLVANSNKSFSYKVVQHNTSDIVTEFDLTNIGIDDIKNLKETLDNKIDNSKIGNNAGQIPEIGKDGKLDSSIIPVTITVSDVVKKVNGVAPDSTGNVNINGTNINADVGGNDTVQNHLTNIKDEMNNTNKTVAAQGVRIDNLQARKSTVRVGEIVSTFYNSESDYSLNGVSFLYIGKERVIKHTTYPQLAPALGLSNVVNYALPVIPDTVITYYNGLKTAKRKHFIVANIK